MKQGFERNPEENSLSHHVRTKRNKDVVHTIKGRSKFDDSLGSEESRRLERSRKKQKVELEKALMRLKSVQRKMIRENNCVRPELDIFEDALTKLIQRNDIEENINKNKEDGGV